MKLLHVTPFYEPFSAYGGMVRSVSALCRELASRGHEVTVATTRLSPLARREETLGGVHVVRFDGPAALNRLLMPWVRGLRRFVDSAEGAAEVVHLHGVRNGLTTVAASALASAGRAFVLAPHGGFPNHGQFRLVKALFDAVLGSRVVPNAAALVAVSDAEARDLSRPARIVPNGVAACGRAGPRRRGGRARVLFVGTDRPQKRGQLLPELLDRLPDVELQLVGRFGRSFLASLSRHASRVDVRGVLEGDALAQAYADADVLVHPAVGEAFGLVPFEAALAGTPAVVAGGHGCGEWFSRAGGAVVPPDDGTALVAAVRVRLADPALSGREADAVARYASERLTWARAAAEIECVYHDVAGGRS